MHTLVNADAIEHLRSMAAGSVHCIVTSPPYFNQRDYGHDGQIGLEGTVEEYVAKMTDVLRECRRVLRDDGTLWLNVGDSYGSGKQLLGVPWRLAFAAQADGWLLRQDIIWHKASPMPESVTDRCTKAHEYVFILAKSPTYFFDAEAIKEPLADSSLGRAKRKERLIAKTGVGTLGKQIRDGVDGSHGYAGLALGRNGKTGYDLEAGTRNRRSVWKIAARPYSGAHFATMPPELAETCIKSGTSEHGCCPQCGAPWERVTKRTKLKRQRPNDYVKRTGEAGTGSACANSVAGVAVETVGWKQSCDCQKVEFAPCVVLDPFAGSGTTLAVAKTLGRDSIGIELNPDYIALAEQRIAEAGTVKKTKRPRAAAGQGSLFRE
jgi:DNA modification methylase